jgi:hypothetical protein
MANYGQAKFVILQELIKQIIEFRSRADNTRVYRFRKKSCKRLRNNEISEYWICLDCENISDHCCWITLQNHVIKKNSDHGHCDQCVGRAFGATEAQNLDREARADCQNGLKRLLESHTAMNSEIHVRYQTLTLENQAIWNLRTIFVRRILVNWRVQLHAVVDYSPKDAQNAWNRQISLTEQTRLSFTCAYFMTNMMICSYLL